MPSLKTYLRLLEKNLSPFDCPHCSDVVSFKNFEQHCLTRHELNPDTHCVWCFGNTFWTRDTQANRADHLTKCYSSFLSSHETVLPVPSFTSSTTPTLFDLQPMCEEKTFGDHMPVPHLPETPVWVVHPSMNGVTFQSPQINLAVACLQLYLRLKPISDWMHVMVKAPAYVSFVKALDADAGITCTLPFSCFCSGGGTPHRHFIVLTTPRNHFLKKTWKNIQCSKKSENIKRETIYSPLQLVYLIGSLSQQRSQCHFTFYTLKQDPVGELNHYYIALSLPSVYKVILALQWDGGLWELLYQKYSSMDPHWLAPLTLSCNGLLGIRFRDLPGIERNSVLPVSKKFQHTLTPTEFYVHLFQNEKMYFELCDERQQDWEKGEAEKGNWFYDVIGEALFYPTPYQQKGIRFLKPFLEEINRLQGLTEDTHCRLNLLDVTLTHLRKANRNLKRKYNASETQLKSLQKRHIEYLEKENDKLREERDGLKKIRMTE